MKVKRQGIKLSTYNISKDRYYELKYFCLQYLEKKSELAYNYGLSSVENDGQPKGNLTGNPTSSLALKNIQLKKDIELIEQTVVEADAEISEWLLKNITIGTPYEYLDAPVGRRHFYDSRRYFFYLLSQKK